MRAKARKLLDNGLFYGGIILMGSGALVALGYIIFVSGIFFSIHQGIK